MPERDKFEDIVSFDINKPKTHFRSKSSVISYNFFKPFVFLKLPSPCLPKEQNVFGEYYFFCSLLTSFYFFIYERVSKYKKRQQKYKVKATEKKALFFNDAHKEIPGNEVISYSKNIFKKHNSID
jgi:hypothetical protein